MFIVLYLVTRLYSLMDLPIFNDEAFFLWVGQQIRLDPLKNLFINFSDGKEPLFFWLYSPADSLLKLRLLSVFFGLLTFIYFRKITKNIWASIFFIASPFLLFYQRLGMQETLLTFLLTAATYYLIKNKHLMTGIFIGLSLLTKTSALAFVIPLLIFKFNLKTILIALLIYLPVFLMSNSVFGHNSSYVGLIPPGQIVTNLKMSTNWLWGYQGFWGVLGMLMPPVIIESFIAKIFFPRYFLFIIPFLIILVTKFTPRLVLLLFLIPNLILSFQIIKDVKTANLPYIEKWQYLEAWPAGYGIEETANFLKTNHLNSVITEDIMITNNGLSYYYPALKVSKFKSLKDEGVFVFKKSKEIADEMNLVKLYNSYDVSVYRSRSGSQ